MDSNQTYEYLIKHCTQSLLKETAVKIIDAYKSKNLRSLRRIAGGLFPETDSDDRGNKLFFALIKYFHPDRYSLIMKDIEESYNRGDEKKLGFYYNLISGVIETRKTTAKDYSFDTEEEFGFDESDLDFELSEYAEDDTSEGISESDGVFDFYSAVKSALYGNLDFSIGPEDLEFLAGDLDLSDFGLDELDGLEYCVRITSLNLSDNIISNLADVEPLVDLRELYLANNAIMEIESLAHLANLEILDLSGNEIEDISPIAGLEHLEFVDIRDNPIRDRALISVLKERGVVVIE
jgi:hypothetical protein